MKTSIYLLTTLLIPSASSAYEYQRTGVFVQVMAETRDSNGLTEEHTLVSDTHVGIGAKNYSFDLVSRLTKGRNNCAPLRSTNDLRRTNH